MIYLYIEGLNSTITWNYNYFISVSSLNTNRNTNNQFIWTLEQLYEYMKRYGHNSPNKKASTMRAEIHKISPLEDPITIRNISNHLQFVAMNTDNFFHNYANLLYATGWRIGTPKQLGLNRGFVEMTGEFYLPP